MKFSIIHPTARLKPMGSFPLGWLGAYRDFFVACSRPEGVEYIVVVHHSRIAQFYKELQFRTSINPLLCWGRFSVVVNYNRDCVVDQCNAGLLAATGEIQIAIMDDLMPPPGWDTEILKHIPDTSLPVALACNPRERKDLYNLPSICTKVLQDRIGPIPTDYESMFADNEWSEVARREGRVIEVPLTFDHPHSLTNQRNEMDEVYSLQNRPEAYRKGEQVYLRRKAAGFPRVGVIEAKTGPAPLPPRPGIFGKAIDWFERKANAPSAPPVVEAPALRDIAILAPSDEDRGHCPRWEYAFIDVLGSLSGAGWKVEPRFDGCSTNVYGTRMVLVDRLEATGTEYDRVLWIDDDNVLTGAQALQMNRYLDEHPKVDGVVGWCFIRLTHPKTGQRQTITSCGNFAANGIDMVPIAPEKLLDGIEPKPIECSGFPVFLVRYNVVKALGRSAFAPIFHPDCFLGFCGEDIAWFKRAKDAGYRFVVDPTVKVPHLKLRPEEPDLVVHMDSPEPVRQAQQQILEAMNGKAVHLPQAAYEVMGGKAM